MMKPLCPAISPKSIKSVIQKYLLRCQPYVKIGECSSIQSWDYAKRPWLPKEIYASLKICDSSKWRNEQYGSIKNEVLKRLMLCLCKAMAKDKTRSNVWVE